MEFPSRYDQCTFDKFDWMMKNIWLRYCYRKWKCGVDYTCNRPIVIGSPLHRALKNKFMIHPCRKSHDRIHTQCEPVLYTELIGIDRKQYLKETKNIYGH